MGKTNSPSGQLAQQNLNQIIDLEAKQSNMDKSLMELKVSLNYAVDFFEELEQGVILNEDLNTRLKNEVKVDEPLSSPSPSSPSPSSSSLSSLSTTTAGATIVSNEPLPNPKTVIKMSFEPEQDDSDSETD